MIFNHIVINVTHLSKVNDARNNNLEKYLEIHNKSKISPNTHPLPFNMWKKYIQKKCDKLQTTFTVEEKVDYVNIEPFSLIN